MIGFLNITVVELFAIALVSVALCLPCALLAAQAVVVKVGWQRRLWADVIP